MRNLFENDIVQEDLETIYLSSDKKWEELRDKTILISGAYGMVASYFVYYFIYLNEKYNFNITIIATGRERHKAEERFGKAMKYQYFRFLEQDISETIEYGKKIDYIIHAASPASSSYYNKDPVSVIKPNVLGTMNTLDLATSKKSKGYLYVSTGEIYGAIKKQTIVESDCGVEINTLDVRNCYCESKRLGEMLCCSYQHQYHVPIKIARLGHTFGPTLSLNDERVFSQFINDILFDRNITLNSDGTAIRTFCYISDAVSGMLKILLEGDGAYNVTNKDGRISIVDLANLLVSLYPDKNLQVKYQTPDTDNKYIENPHKIHSRYDTNRLEALGWKCKYGIEESFKRTIASIVHENDCSNY